MTQYRRIEEYDNVLRWHLRLAPPEPERYCSFSGRVRVGERWMPLEEYRWRYPDYSQEETKPVNGPVSGPG